MKRLLFLLVLACGVVLNGFAQRHTLTEVDAEKPEGQLLQQIGQEEDPAKKLALLEQFTQQYPKHEAAGWVLEQMHLAYAKGTDHDKTIATGEKLLALDPEDIESSLRNLKAAEAKNDARLITEWSGKTGEIAAKIASSPQPKEQDEIDHWKQQVDYAKQVGTYSEYSLYAHALQAQDPRQRIELIEALKQRNPASEYVPQLAGPLFLAYRQAGDNEKAIALAEQTLEKDQNNEDMLLVVADHYLQTKKEPEKLQAYTKRIIEVVESKPKPEGVADADWQKRNSAISGLAYYISGKHHFSLNRFAPADAQLRAALPLIDEALKAETLFMLGLANYKLDKIQDAANFNRQCAAIKSPFQARAQQNLKAIQTQYRGIK